MIDPRIPMMGQSPDMIEAVNNGFADGGNLAKLVIGSQVNRMRDIEDPTQRQAFANKNFFGRQLRAQLKEDNAAAYQAQLAQQKALADIGKTQSEAFKNNTQGQGYGLDNSSKRQAAIENVIQQAAMTGDPGQVLIGLNRLAKTGLITPEQYQQETAIVQTMTPEELQKYAQGSALTNKEVAPYLYQTQNNAADNAQSDKNSQRTYDASIYSTDTAASTADKNRAQQQSQFEQNYSLNAQKAFFEQNKPTAYGVDNQGRQYAVLADGRAVYVKDDQGNYVTAQPKGGSNAQKSQFENQEKIIGFEASAESAADAATLARTLADDKNGLSSATGGLGVMARIPGTDARAYVDKLETLKSQVFLTQVEKMKGMGALTDAEGARLEKSIASLDHHLSAEQLRSNLLEIERVLKRAEQTARQKAQLYKGGSAQQGVPYANAGQQSQSTFNLFD